ncbi:MAG: methyltransferase domain-containing protein [bacterium]
MSDWDGALYHRVANPQFQWGVEVLDRLVLAGDERVLDAGCGSGRLTAEVVKRVPRGRVVAADLSASMAQQAQRHLGRAADVVRVDLLSLPFHHAFDVVFSNAAFHWVLDQPRLARELHGALKPGGRLHAQCGGGANLKRLHDHAEATMREPAFSRFFGSWQEPWEYQDEATARRRLEAAGFHRVQAWLEERPTTFATGQDFREFVGGIVLRTHLGALPDETLRAAFMDRIMEFARADEPAFTLDYWRLNLEATA